MYVICCVINPPQCAVRKGLFQIVSILGVADSPACCNGCLCCLSYACTVCHHRPVFNTVEMLVVHRNGKKHMACMLRLYGKKAAHRNEVQKRQHEQYVQAEEAGEQKGEEPSEDLERRRVMEHYLSLRSSGWIPDGTGKWVKDENVEFDSDEEEPPAVPPP
ncbi:hypothetical protein GDO78_010156 [Eleutherodactylus coqui]|uniref:Sodium channel modifier 1 n=1 Tax=Eleutherodactylus coqui TaxID=57060 RepID=A0A8J6F547_ELECQ|nr:hypothetical protein GDO78_010156 [Eleutherodactylus coqui]